MSANRSAGAVDVIDALAAEQADFAGLLSGRDGDDWQRPTPCEGWNVADVVLHVAQSNDLAIASLTGQFTTFGGFTGAARESGAADGAGSGAAAGSAGGAAPATVDEAADLAVARERGQPGSAVLARWQATAAELMEQLRRGDLDRRVQWVAGRMSARTLAATRLAETWIHGGDVAAALGADPIPSDRLWHIARLAWRTLPYAFARAGRELRGPVAFELVGPGGDQWSFVPDTAPSTVVRGDALQLCLVAGRRADPVRTELTAEGPDAASVLELVRTYA